MFGHGTQAYGIDVGPATRHPSTSASFRAAPLDGRIEPGAKFDPLDDLAAVRSSQRDRAEVGIKQPADQPLGLTL